MQQTISCFHLIFLQFLQFYKMLLSANIHGDETHQYYRKEQLNITSRCITRSRQDLRARDTLPSLTTSFRDATVDARSYTMMRYVMMRIHGIHAPTKHRRSPGVHCTSLGRLGGDEPARLTDAKPGTKDRQGLKWRVWRLPTVTDFPLKVRGQGAGL